MTDDNLMTEALEDPELNLDEVLAQLNAGVDVLPEAALRWAQQHREQITPRLIEALRGVTARAAAGEEITGSIHVFALFLLTEFRSQEAWPAILEVLSLPGELPEYLFGDVLCETLKCVFAGFLSETPDVLDDIIANRALLRDVRWAALFAYLYLVRDGKLTRDEVGRRMHQHLIRANQNKDNIAAMVIYELMLYAPAAALPDIEEAFRLGIVDETLVVLDEVYESIPDADEEFNAALKNCGPTGIPDTIAEMSNWFSFSNKPGDAEEYEPYLPGLDGPDNFDEMDDAELEMLWRREMAKFREHDPLPTSPPPVDPYTPLTIRHTDERVGRNDPCPCGSGKKFKKCCSGR